MALDGGFFFINAEINSAPEDETEEQCYMGSFSSSIGYLFSYFLPIYGHLA